MDVHIEPEKNTDRDRVERIHRAAYRGDREARLLHELRMTPAYIRELSLVARDDERAVGHVLFSRMEIEGEAEPVGALVMVPLSVDPEFQDRGVAREMVEAGLTRAREFGHRIVVALGDPAFLDNFGFAPAGRAKLRPPFQVFGQHWMVLALVPDGLDGISGRLNFPPPFGICLGH